MKRAPNLPLKDRFFRSFAVWRPWSLLWELPLILVLGGLAIYTARKLESPYLALLFLGLLVVIRIAITTAGISYTSSDMGKKELKEMSNKRWKDRGKSGGPSHLIKEILRDAWQDRKNIKKRK